MALSVRKVRLTMASLTSPLVPTLEDFLGYYLDAIGIFIKFQYFRTSSIGSLVVYPTLYATIKLINDLLKILIINQMFLLKRKRMTLNSPSYSQTHDYNCRVFLFPSQMVLPLYVTCQFSTTLFTQLFPTPSLRLLPFTHPRIRSQHTA